VEKFERGSLPNEFVRISIEDGVQRKIDMGEEVPPDQKLLISLRQFLGD
jgi:hypothetical protein